MSFNSLVFFSVGLCHSFLTLILCHRSLQSPRNTTLGDHVAPTEDRGGESDPGVVHSKEGSSRSEEESSRSDEDSYISEEETQSKSVHNEEGIAEVKKLTEDEDDEEIH